MKNLLYAVIALTVASIILYVEGIFSQPGSELCQIESPFIAPPSSGMAPTPVPTECGQKIHQHLLNFSIATDHSYYRTDTIGQECYLYLEVKADQYQPPVEDLRPSVNLAIVIDRSGSMAGDKLKYAKEAAKFVVNMLEDRDFVSIVMYDEEVDVVVKSTPVKDKKSILQKIDNIREDGATNLCGGMMEGYQQAAKNKDPHYVNKVLLLSDGLVNEGITDENAIQNIAMKEDTERGISISTFGIGLDFNEKLMTGLAERGNGNYYFIANAENIPSIFDRELSGLLKVVAQNTRLTIDLPSGVHVSKAYGGNYVLAGNQVSINLRDIYSEETKAIMIKFKIDDGYSQPLAFQTHLYYDDAVSKTTGQDIGLSTSVMPTQAMQQYASSATACVMQQIAMYRVNERLEEAMKATENGDVQTTYMLLDANAQELEEISSVYGTSIELQRMDSLNVGYTNKAKEYDQMSSQDQKILMKSSREANYQMRKKK